jgi:hypothetical protein
LSNPPAPLENLCAHTWHVSTHQEDVPPTELRRRAKAYMKQMALG